MNSASLITLLFMVCFFAIMLWIGLRARRHAGDIDGFVLGSRQVGPWLSAFAYGTSYFSAVIFVGYAGQFGWNFGLASTWIGLGNAFIGSLLAWLILGRRTRIMTQHLSSKTMPDFFGTRYESPKLRTAASLITFVFLIPYTASLYNGLSRLFAIAFPGVDYAVCVLLMAVLTGIYVILGGYMATAWNDFIQGIIMLFGIVAVIAAVLGDNGGLSLAMERLATGPTGGWQYASFLGADPMFLLFVVILTSLGTWGLPQMVGKFYAINFFFNDTATTEIYTLFAVVVAGGCYFLGGFGRLYDIDVQAEGFDAVVPRMLSSLPAVIIGIVIVLVLSASMFLTSASTMTLDLIAPHKKKPLRERGQLLIMRGFVVLFIAVSALIAIKQARSRSLFIAQMMGVSWGALAGAFLAPFLYGLYSKRATKLSAAVCFLWGVGLETVQLLVSLGMLNVSSCKLLAFVFKNSIYSGVIAMVGGLILVPLVDLFARRFRPVRVEDMFSAYQEHRTVDITDNLGK